MAGTEDTVTRELVCTLNEVELLERGDQMAAAELAGEQLRIERRKLNAQLRERTDRRAELANIIETKQEPREVTCKWKPDYKAKVFVLVRMDTNAEIEQRQMSEADLQQRLPIEVDDVRSKPAPKANGKRGASKRGAYAWEHFPATDVPQPSPKRKRGAQTAASHASAATSRK